jgi:hypothetical protein
MSKPVGTTDGHRVSRGDRGNMGGNDEDDDDDDDDEDYASGSNPDSSEVSDSDNVISEGGDESYGFGDLLVIQGRMSEQNLQRFL